VVRRLSQGLRWLYLDVASLSIYPQVADLAEVAAARQGQVHRYTPGKALTNDQLRDARI